jgi:16S rRNA (cytosine1402-N4)-methyltransferase
MNDSASNSGARHIPVMPTEVIQFLSPAPGAIIVDATVGAGGHARLLAEKIAPSGRLIGIDQDEEMLALTRVHLRGLPVTLMQANFDQLREVLDRLDLAAADGVLADLGVCSDQIEPAERGFSFQASGPLDMRMDRSQRTSAATLLRTLDERQLADLFWKYGEERFSRKIARKIVETRRKSSLETTADLADLVRRCVPRYRVRGRTSIDPATRVFQALRIAVNDEMGALERLLKSLPDCIKPNGRAVIISFHSLEDRLVKQTFREDPAWENLTRKPIRPGQSEMEENPRARSAKLRAARRLETDGTLISRPLKGVGR